MAGNGGFGITISAVDNASRIFDGLNKRMAALSAPAERFNRSLAKFGETSGLSRVTEGIRSLGRGAADTFRSLDRMASPLAAITGAASIAGVVELSRRWAEFGTHVGQVSYRLSLPVEKLGALRGAARLAGVDAASLDSGLRGLQDTLSGAAFGRNSHAVQLFNSLNGGKGVAFKDAAGNARRAADAIGDIADAIQGLKPETQARVLNELGIGEGLLPMLKNGRKGLEEFTKQAERTGASLTPQMVAHATAMNRAWTELGLAIEGVGNRLVDDYAPAVTRTLNKTADWIEKNKKTAETIGEIGIAIGGLIALKPAGWVLKLLGLSVAPEAAVLASPLLLHGDTGPTAPDGRGGWNFSGTRGPGWFQQGGAFERWVRRQFGGGIPRTGTIAVPRAPSNAAAVMQQTHDFWRSKGFTEEQTAGILAGGPAAESSFNPDVVGDNGSSYGLYQHHNERMRELFRRYGTHPTVEQQNQFAFDELNDPQNRNLIRSLHSAQTPEDAARLFTLGFERPAEGSAEADRRAAAAGQFVQAPGHVQVDVHLKNAPPGTTARVTTSGPVTAPPPRVETSLPMVN